MKINISLISVGTLLEYFDFISFSIMYKNIPFIAKSGVIVQFVLGYGFRFIGSLALLKITKQIGSLKTLAISIITISIATILISVLPNHEYSFYLLILLRAIQSLAFAVEFPTGASVFKTGIVVSAATQGYILSSMLCSLIFNYLSPEQISSFGWRTPFIIGGTIGIILSIARLKYWMTDNPPKDNPKLDYIISSLAPQLFLIIGLFVSYNIISNVSLPETMILCPCITTRNPYIMFGAMFIGAIALILGYMPKGRIQRWISIAARAIIYFALLYYSISTSLLQTYMTSHATLLAPFSTIALIFSALFAQLERFRIFNFQIYDIAVALVFLSLCGLDVKGVLYNLCASHLGRAQAIMAILILNQFFITSFMIKSFAYAKKLFGDRTYLIPPVYNGITFISSFLFSELALVKWLNGLGKAEVEQLMLSPKALGNLKVEGV